MTQYTDDTHATSNRIIRWPELHKRIGLSRSQIHNLVAKGLFPAQIKLSDRASGWLESQVNDWLEQKIKNQEQLNNKTRKTGGAI